MSTWRIYPAALTGLFLFGCGQAADKSPDSPPASQAALPVPRLPAVELPLGREALILAAVHAASATASGAEDREKQAQLDGKRFELRLRFGCAGQEPGGGDRQVTVDENRRVLRFNVGPDITAETPVLGALGFGEFEAAEGFWIKRPWLLSAACPPPAAGLAAASPPGETANEAGPEGAAGGEGGIRTKAATPLAGERPRLGIVQVYTASDARTHRNDSRGYRASRPLAAGAAPSAGGYDLVVTGRLTRTARGEVIACIGDDPFSPPVCLISAVFDRIAIVDPATREMLAEWSGV